MKEIHPIQIEILRRLLYSNGLPFSVLKKDLLIENSQFTFHLDKLVQNGFVTKDDSNYILTAEGKEFANRMDADTSTIKQFPKTTTVLGAVRGKGENREVLVYFRKKNPFYGFYGLPTQKVLFGQSIVETATKGLKDESGLVGNAHVKAVRHYRVYEKGSDEVKEDKIMYICLFINPTGEIVNSEEGEYFWVKLNEIKDKVKNPLPEFQETLDIILGEIEFEFFREDRFIVGKF